VFRPPIFFLIFPEKETTISIKTDIRAQDKKGNHQEESIPK